MSNKPRKRKVGKQNNMRNANRNLELADAQARQALNQVWCADGMMCSGLMHGGVQDPFFPLPRTISRAGISVAAWQNIVIHRISEILDSEPLDWTVWIGVFETHGVKGEWVTDLGKMTSNEAGPIVDAQLDKLRAGRNPKFAISYGWFATPKQDVDLGDLEKKIYDKFVEWGAFDKQLCQLTNYDRKQKEAA